MKLLRNILWITTLLLSTQIQATIYENAEDGSTSRWHIYDNTPSNASIENIYVSTKDNNAIEFQGSGTRNGYILGNLEGLDGAWDNKIEKTIRWSMKFKESFVIYIRVLTTYGARYIYYTNSKNSYGKNGEYIHIALGKKTSNATWQTISRNLEDDLKKYEPNNFLVSVNAFLIRGNGLIDDVNLINKATTSKYIYGLTLDDISNIDTTVDAIKSLSKRTTTRVVFDKVPASDYTNALYKLSPYTDIMGLLFDSEYIKDYSLEAYKNRVKEYLNTHADKVQIWEIGNEVNGEWTGNPINVAKKTIAAYKEVKKRGYLTALTLYYNDYSENDGCWENSDEKMREWAKNRLSDELKNGIDYIFISYYEEDCNYHQPTLAEWESVFADLATIFPHAKLGFGEVGTTTQNKIDYLNHYYGYTIKNSSYIGGHFWWYFKQDMVPKNKSLWNTFNQFLLKK